MRLSSGMYGPTCPEDSDSCHFSCDQLLLVNRAPTSRSRAQLGSYRTLLQGPQAVSAYHSQTTRSEASSLIHLVPSLDAIRALDCMPPVQRS